MEAAKCAIVSVCLVSGTKPSFTTQISYYHGNTEKLSAVYCNVQAEPYEKFFTTVGKSARFSKHVNNRNLSKLNNVCVVLTCSLLLSLDFQFVIASCRCLAINNIIIII